MYSAAGSLKLAIVVLEALPGCKHPLELSLLKDSTVMLNISLCLHYSLLELAENCLYRDVICPAIHGSEQDLSLVCSRLHNTETSIKLTKCTFAQLASRKLGSLSIVLV